MRVAVCLSGMLRSYKETYKYLYSNIIKPFNADVFFCGYANKEGVDSNKKDFQEMFEPKSFLISEYNESKRNEVLNCLKLYSQYFNRKRQETNIDNFINQFYNIMKVCELKNKYEYDNSFKYDLVIRSRCDVFYRRSLHDFEINLGMTKNNILIPREWDFKNVSSFAVSDTFALCSSETFDKYSSLYNYIDSYWSEGCIFHNESLMGYHIKKQQFNRIEIETPFLFEHPENLQNYNRHEY